MTGRASREVRKSFRRFLRSTVMHVAVPADKECPIPHSQVQSGAVRITVEFEGGLHAVSQC